MGHWGFNLLKNFDVRLIRKNSDLLVKIAVFNNFANNLNEYEHKSKPRFTVIKGRHE